MKLFECQNCGQPLYFENTSCESCGLRLGYLPDQQVVTALREADGLRGVRSRCRSRFIASAPMRNTMSAIGSSAATILTFFVRPAATTAPSPISPLRRTSCIGAGSSSPSIGCSIRS